jgi:glycosyltransferase involved in cell wall biosynthesis
LIAHLARRRPQWSIALVGNTHVDISRLSGLANVHFLGPKPHASLPMYCKGLAVGLIPQKINELTIHMNPLKLREYLSAGLPVVSTALPEVAQYAPWAAAADSHEQFEQAVAAAIADDTPQLRRQRSDAMAGETWQRKVAELGATVMQVKAEKCRTTQSSRPR